MDKTKGVGTNRLSVRSELTARAFFLLIKRGEYVDRQTLYGRYFGKVTGRIGPT